MVSFKSLYFEVQYNKPCYLSNPGPKKEWNPTPWLQVIQLLRNWIEPHILCFKSQGELTEISLVFPCVFSCCVYLSILNIRKLRMSLYLRFHSNWPALGLLTRLPLKRYSKKFGIWLQLSISMLFHCNMPPL